MSKTVLLIAFFVIATFVEAAPAALDGAAAQQLVSHEEGFVVDGVSQSGIVGAFVTFYKLDSGVPAAQPAGTGTTDAGGKYYVLLETGKYHRVVSASGYQESSYNGDYGQTDAHQHDIELVATGGGTELRGKIYDARDGSPLSDVSINVYGSKHRWFLHNFTATGEYSVRLPGADDYDVRFSKTGFVDIGIGLFVGDDEAAVVQSMPLMARDAKWGRVTLHVLAQGMPVAGASVHFQGVERSWSHETRTSSTGIAGIVAFADEYADSVGGPAIPTALEITASHPDHGEATTSLRVAEGEVNSHRLSLSNSQQGGKARIEGRVMDEAGAPIAGATVRLNNDYSYYVADGAEPQPAAVSKDEAASSVVRPWPCCDYEYQETTTGPDGEYAFDTFAGAKRISVEARGYGYTNKLVTVGEGETVRADFILEKVPGYTVKVSGTVIDAKTGKPIRGASVNVENVEWSRYNYTTTDGDGRFSLMTMPGYVNVVIRYDDYCCVVYAAESGSASGSGGSAVDASRAHDAEAGAAEPTTASSTIAPPPRSNGPSYYTYVTSFEAADGETVTIDARLQPKPAADSKIIGYVVDSRTDQAIPGAYVYVQNEDTGDWGYATTDENGSFIFEVRPGHHLVGASAEGHFHKMVAVEVGAQDVQRADLLLVPGEQKYAPYEEYYYRCPPEADCVAAGESRDATGAPSSASGEAQSTSVADSAAFAGREGRATYSGKGGLPKYGEKINLEELGAKCEGGLLECPKVPGPEAGLIAAAIVVSAMFMSRRKK